MALVQDTGWSWVVLVGSFTMHFLILGLTRAFSLWIIEIRNRFQVTVAASAAVGSTLTAVRLLLSPVSVAVSDKFTHQVSAMIGGLLSAVGIIGAAYSNSFVLFFFFYSIVGGLGATLAYTSGIIILTQSFCKKRSIALSIATCGAGFGCIIIVPLVDLLMKEFDFSSAMLLSSGFALQLIPCGALYLTTEADDDTKKNCVESENIIKEVKNNTKAEKDTFDDTTNIQNGHPKIIIQIDAELDETPVQNNSSISVHLQKENAEKKRSKYSVLEVAKWIGEKVWYGLGISILIGNRDISILLLGNIFCFMGAAPVFLIIKDFAMIQGVSSDGVTLMLSIEGAIVVVSRFGIGFFFQHPRVKPWRGCIWTGFIAVMVVGDLAFLFCSSLLSFIIVSIFWNMCFGCIVAQQITILGDIVPTDIYARCIGLQQFTRGIGIFLGGPIIGWVRDLSGSYTGSYILISIFQFIGFVLTLVVILRHRKPLPEVKEDFVKEDDERVVSSNTNTTFLHPKHALNDNHLLTSSLTSLHHTIS